MGVGLWIRVSIEESPVFRAAQEHSAKAEEAPKLPVVQVLRDYPREIILAIGARFAENIGYYIFTAFALAYATGEAGISRGTALGAALIASAIHFVAIPVMGALSDRFGRRPVYLVGAVGVGVWGFVFFALSTRSRSCCWRSPARSA